MLKKRDNRDLIRSSRSSFMKQLSIAVTECQWLYIHLTSPHICTMHSGISCNTPSLLQRHRHWCSQQPHHHHHHYLGKMKRFSFCLTHPNGSTSQKNDAPIAIVQRQILARYVSVIFFVLAHFSLMHLPLWIDAHAYWVYIRSAMQSPACILVWDRHAKYVCFYGGCVHVHRSASHLVHIKFMNFIRNDLFTY